MTFALTDILLFVIAGMLMVMAGLQIWLAIRVSKMLADVRKTIDRIDGIAKTAEAGVALAQQVLAPPLMRIGALIGGIKRGFRKLTEPVETSIRRGDPQAAGGRREGTDGAWGRSPREQDLS